MIFCLLFPKIEGCNFIKNYWGFRKNLLQLQKPVLLKVYSLIKVFLGIFWYCRLKHNFTWNSVNILQLNSEHLNLSHLMSVHVEIASSCHHIVLQINFYCDQVDLIEIPYVECRRRHSFIHLTVCKNDDDIA